MAKLKIIADENIPRVVEVFNVLGDVETVNGRLLSNEQVRGADVLLVRSVTQVNESLLEGSNVRFVASATIGIDHIDTNYLDATGIGWASAPGSNADSVVDYVISVFCRLEGVLDSLLSKGIVGIVGMGNVGGRLYQRLSALGISCCCYDPLLDQSSHHALTDLKTVLASDVICLHAPLTQGGNFPSYHLLEQRQLASLKPGTVLINAGRGAVVDNDSLLALLEERDDLCVVLDVWENEPAINLELLKRVDLGSPHIAGYSLDGKRAGTAMIFQSCCEHLNLDKFEETAIEENDLSIEISEKYDVVAAMKEAVLACYDVARDDQNLRGGLLHCPVDERPAKFDQLRKNYPERREFSKYRIVNLSELDKDVIGGLRALGFN